MRDHSEVSDLAMRAYRGNLDEAENYIRRLNVKVERMLRRNWRKLEALAEELLRAKTLTYRECVEVFNRPAMKYQERS